MEQHICKNCGKNFTGKYCNHCGQKAYTDHDKSVVHLVAEGFHFLTHFEGTLFNTLKVIFTRPGKLSVDYCNGVRKKYFKPLSFFLLLVILYLLFPVFEGLNMKMEYHRMHPLYGSYASKMIIKKMAEKGISENALAASFHHAGEKTSKFLLFSIIPVVACASWILGFRKRKYYFDHFIFTIEVSSFFILWGFLLLPLLLIIAGWMSFKIIVAEWQTGIGIFSVFIIYTRLAAKRFFNFNGWYSFLYAVLFSISLIAFIQYVYKFILFLIAIRLA